MSLKTETDDSGNVETGTGAPDTDDTLNKLRKELLWLVLSGLAALILCSGMLTVVADPDQVLTWLVTAGLSFALVWQQSRKRLALNRSELLSPLYPDLGWANRMTFARGWLVAATAGFLLISPTLQQHAVLVWIAAASYSVAAIFDRVDGFIARKTQRSSILGAELDTVFDAFGLLVAPLLALLLGKIHPSYLLVSIAYYFFVLGIMFRRRYHKPVYPLAPSRLRRTLAGFQMAYVAVVLWPPFKAEVTVVAGFGFMLPLLAGFLVDWCVVSGRLDAGATHTIRFFRTMNTMSNTFLLPAIRLAMIPAVLTIASQSTWPAAVQIIVFISLALIAPGMAGRTGAMLLLMLLAWTVPVPVGEPIMLLTLFGAITIILLGCGRFSVWQADDDWINRQDGA